MQTNPRALKQRQDLLNSFDTLSSHLETTFSALSTALARSRSNPEFPLAQVYLAFLVGPGIRTAKARVILGIDGLEKRIWGSREESRPSDIERPDSKDDTDTEGDESEMNEGDDEGEEEPEESEDEDSDDENSFNSSDDSEPKSSRHDFVDPTPHVSRAEEQKFLQNADRHLSRVLANADANGKGMISEMGENPNLPLKPVLKQTPAFITIAPTQTHILIRAPRRFVHPAWIPCQNVNSVLDGALDEFVRGPERRDVPNPPIQRSNKVLKAEGVWVTTRLGIQKLHCPPLQEGDKSTTRDEEDDDLIWWSWDGKLLGFSDW